MSQIIENRLIQKIWDRFHHELKGFIISKVHEDAIADDILQEVFLRIHSKVGTLQDQTKIKSWIFQITRNLVIDYFRSKRKTDQNDLMAEYSDEAVDSDFMKEALDDMIHMMDKLPEEYCEILCLTELENMTHKDYAIKAGISYTAAKTRAFRARLMLKDMLMKCCHYQFDKYGTVLEILPADCCCCSEIKHQQKKI